MRLLHAKILIVLTGHQMRKVRVTNNHIRKELALDVHAMEYAYRCELSTRRVLTAFARKTFMRTVLWPDSFLFSSFSIPFATSHYKSTSAFFASASAGPIISKIAKRRMTLPRSVKSSSRPP